MSATRLTIKPLQFVVVTLRINGTVKFTLKTIPAVLIRLLNAPIVEHQGMDPTQPVNQGSFPALPFGHTCGYCNRQHHFNHVP